MSKTYLDVIFYDVTAYKPYDLLSLATEPLGGTEATVVRVAQALGDLGYRVGVVQRCLLSTTTYGNVFYLPESSIPNLDTKRLVMIRGIVGNDLFPQAQKYSWLHDLPSDKLATWVDTLLSKNIHTICVSSWHKTEAQRFLCEIDRVSNPRVTFIHNPIEASLYDKKKIKYNKNKFVWLSSPHKGLGKAIDVFKRLQMILSEDIKLHVYNPGYLANEVMQHKGIVAHGPTPAVKMWSDIADAFCLLYPCQFKETFGLVVAEVNALGIPAATYSMGATPEIISSEEQMVSVDDEIALLKKIELWYTYDRPRVFSNPKLHIDVVIKEWDSLLKTKNT